MTTERVSLLSIGLKDRHGLPGCAERFDVKTTHTIMGLALDRRRWASRNNIGKKKRGGKPELQQQRSSRAARGIVFTKGRGICLSPKKYFQQIMATTSIVRAAPIRLLSLPIGGH